MTATFTIGKSSTPADDFADTEFQQELDDLHAEPEFAVPNHSASEKSDPPIKRLLLGRPQQRKRAPKIKEPAPRMPTGGLAAPLTDLYTMLGAVLSPMDPVCGGAIINQAPECAKALEKLAKTNPEVRRVLVNLVSTSAWGAVITAHIPIVMAVGMHHIPGLQPRETPPEPPTDLDGWRDGDPHPRATG